MAFLRVPYWVFAGDSVAAPAMASPLNQRLQRGQRSSLASGRTLWCNSTLARCNNRTQYNFAAMPSIALSAGAVIFGLGAILSLLSAIRTLQKSRQLVQLPASTPLPK